MFLREGRALVDFGKPVSIGIRRSKRVACRFTPYIAISRQTATISTSRSLEVKHLLHHCIRELGIVLTVACSLIEVVGKGIGVHHLRQIHRTVEAEAVVVVDSRLARFAFLGSHQDNTERCTRPINRGSGSILQYRNILDVLRIHRIDVTFHTVNQNQRTSA